MAAKFAVEHTGAANRTQDTVTLMVVTTEVAEMDTDNGLDTDNIAVMGATGASGTDK